jgi:hypothetical protein
MKTRLLAALAAAALAAPAISSAQGAPYPYGSTLVRPVIGVGFTSGGTTLANVQYSDGTTYKVRSGGLVDLYGGLEFHPLGTPFAFQGTVGYHFDSQHADNGDVTFSRVPFEFVMLGHVAPQFRLGAGVRFTTNVHLTSSGAGATYGNVKYDNATGFIAKAEWMWAQNAGIELRYVNESYKAHEIDGQAVNGNSIDASHAGIGFNYYFY